MILDIVSKEMAACSREYYTSLIELSNEAPEGVFVECGVARGGSAAVLIDANPKRKIYLCDSYRGFPEPEAVDCETPYIKQNFKKGTCKELDVIRVFNGLKTCGITDLKNVEFIGGFFEDSMPRLKKIIEPIAFIHFDGDFYQGCLDVFDNLEEKVVKGGIMVLHDYPNFSGVKKFVEERWKPEEVNLLLGGCWIKK